MIFLTFYIQYQKSSNFTANLKVEEKLKLSVLKETDAGETRVAIVPKSISKLMSLGFEVMVETNAGVSAAFTDIDYINAGASVVAGAKEAIELSDVIVKLNPPSSEDLANLKSGQIWVSQLFHRLNEDLILSLESKGVKGLSLDAMPRISRAQSMDILSSQSNLSGYKSVICGADNLGKIFPMLTTAAGTITPARVLIFGVGVAGLQAIATAKRLGAIVEATDVRMECKEQTESLGAKFISVEDDGAGVKVEGGYAKEVSEEYLAKQKAAVNKSLAQADLVITTALVQGAKSPILISQEQIEMMKNGSVIVDMAVAKGGNTALSKADETVIHNGVKIVGISNFPAQIPTNASELLSRNIDTFLSHMVSEGNFKWDMEDEITIGTLVTK